MQYPVTFSFSRTSIFTIQFQFTKGFSFLGIRLPDSLQTVQRLRTFAPRAHWGWSPYRLHPFQDFPWRANPKYATDCAQYKAPQHAMYVKQRHVTISCSRTSKFTFQFTNRLQLLGINVRWAKLHVIIYVKFLRDVERQKLLKSANILKIILAQILLRHGV